MATQLLAPPIEGILDEAAIEEFRGSLRGPLMTPGDPGYDEARAVRNGLIDRHPALIARCSGTADVVACVNFARERGLLLSVRGRRAQRRRQRRQRRRPGHRSLEDARRLRRSGGADGPRAGRGNLGRYRPRDAALRPGGAGRRRLQHGNRWIDHPRRVRSSAPQARSEPRQPGLSRDRDRRWPGADGQRNRERRPLLGRARGRQQFRGDHQFRVSTASGRSDRALCAPFYALEDGRP